MDVRTPDSPAATRAFDPTTFLVPTLAVLGILVLVTLAYFGSERAAARQARSFDVKNLLRRAQVYLLEAESAERGFVIAPSPGVLEAYTRAVRGYAANLERLHDALDDDDAQRARLRTVDSLARLQLDEVSTSLARARSVEPAAAPLDPPDDAFMRAIRDEIDVMIAHENQDLEDAPSLQRRYRLAVLALLAVSVLVLLRGLYVIYRRVAPVFDDLETARTELARSNANTMESLARYKKLSAERAAELDEQERLLAQREATLADLQTKTEGLDRVTHAVARELHDDLAQLELQLTEFIDLNSANTSMREVQLSMQLRQTLADMRDQVAELDV